MHTKMLLFEDFLMRNQVINFLHELENYQLKGIFGEKKKTVQRGFMSSNLDFTGACIYIYELIVCRNLYVKAPPVFMMMFLIRITIFAG